MERDEQFFNVTVEINLGFAGRWTEEEVLDCLKNALEGTDGIDIIDAKEKRKK